MSGRVFMFSAVLSLLNFPILIHSARSQCGPGEHWVDNCVEGQETWQNIYMEVHVDITGDCEADGAIQLSGWASVHHSNPSDDSQNYPGTRPVDGHLDVIDTEMLSLDLVGLQGSVIAGAGRGQDNNLAPSLGVMAEQFDNFNVDSFFDVFCEANVNGMYLYNQSAARLSASISQIPPYGSTYTFSECLPAYTSPIPGEGTLAGFITHVTMTVQEQAPIPTLSQWGMILMTLLFMAFGTVAVVRRRRAVSGEIKG